MALNACTAIDGDGKYGLIDHSGNWAVMPAYDYINNPVRHLRIVMKDGSFGVMDTTYNLLLPTIFQFVKITDDGILVVKDQEKYLMDHTGSKVLQSTIYDEVRYLTYHLSTCDNDGFPETRKSDYWGYGVNGKYGILSPDYKPITKAIYTNVDAIDNNHFLCNDDGNKIIIDGSSLIHFHR